MRELHVVALSEDGRSVLLAPTKKAPAGTFRVKLDGKLSAALRGELAREGESGVRAVDVSPKEIQARMRAGESAQQIADAAGVPVARVERFAGPVLSERERIINQARAGFLSRGRLGPSQLSLGDAVQAALAETDSLKPESVEWASRRLDSGHWLVQVSYVARARTKTASWVLDPVTLALTASDPGSSALGHRSDVPRQGAAGAAAAVAAAAGRGRPARVTTRRPQKAAKRPATKTAKPVKAAIAKPVKAATAKPVKPTAGKPTKAAAGLVPKPATRPAARPAKPVKAAKVLKAASVAKAPRPAVTRPVRPDRPAQRPPTLHVVPAPAAEVEVEEQAAPRRRAAGERATVPAWADVLLGIAPRDKADG